MVVSSPVQGTYAKRVWWFIRNQIANTMRTKMQFMWRPSSRALQPSERAGPLSTPENLELRMGEVLGYFRKDR